MTTKPTACDALPGAARPHSWPWTAPRWPAKAGRWSRLFLLLAAALTSTGCTRRVREFDAAKVCALVAAATVAGDDILLARTVAEALGAEPSSLWIDRNGVFVRLGGFFGEAHGLFLARPGVVPPAGGAQPSFTQVSGCVYRYTGKG